MTKFLFLVVGILMAASGARAEFFACSFTEPFFNLYISTQHKIATYAGFFHGEDPGQKVTHILDNKVIVKIELSDGAEIVIDRNTPGSDGMSETRYPYEIKYTMEKVQLWGGCNSGSE